MTATKCSIVVLHTDQGMGTLVKIYKMVDKVEKLYSLALIDLGSETRTKRYAGDAIDVIANAVSEMPTPFIDFVVISHQDTDHWSLLPDLTKRLKKDRPETAVRRLYRGGTRWKQRSQDTVMKFAEEWGAEEEPWTGSYSDFNDPKGGARSFEELDGVVFRTVMVNAVSKKSVENGTSAVISVHFGGSVAVLPGDATSQTLSAINKTIGAWTKNPLQPCRLLTAPHHGALATIADNFTTKKPKLTIATDFGKLINAQWLAASAGFESHFNHPYKVVMEKLSPGVGSKAVKHTYVVYDGSIGDWEAIKDTNLNIFTTIAGLGDPPVRQSWIFTMYPSGLVTFHSELTPSSLREQRALGRVP